MSEKFEWYIIQVSAGSEKKVKEAILETAAKKNLLDLFKEIVIPIIEVPEIKRGKKVLVEKKTMPGYILLNMVITNESWHLVRSVKKVVCFLGENNKPKAISEKEISNIFSGLEIAAKKVSFTKSFEKGIVVEIMDGPFASFSGEIEEVDEEKEKLRISVKILSRVIPIELNFNQVKKS
jgi:transcriptional antiterminator NusG